MTTYVVKKGCVQRTGEDMQWLLCYLKKQLKIILVG